ncbi:unnamed protein product [Miscanthus lutarioriparius]|uniref:DUF3741 domain-containing protein n=1 Tax=Miscanthus lutarioriparius TaxID=422564 RepID=A0A811P1Y3_9POAL|nr:unnamed protein product [Miscanthus lutarioriparius]
MSHVKFRQSWSWMPQVATECTDVPWNQFPNCFLTYPCLACLFIQRSAVSLFLANVRNSQDKKNTIMHQDSFRSVVCRSLSKSLPPRSKDGSCPETVQCAVPCIVTLQPSVCRNCQGQEQSTSQSYREERSMSFHGDYLMAPSVSKHFAEDLLRGAMDLQESLVMLERFQAASQSMRLPNKKRGPETGEKSPEIDTIIREVLLRPTNAKQVLPVSANDGLNKQLRNSTDQLKNVVKDSFYRKNHLSVPNNEQASLNQSARYLQNNYLMSKPTQQKKVVPRSLPSCAAVQPGKSKGPSLVAKLMGLDGLPSPKGNSTVKDDKIKTANSPRALFDIERPKSKRLLPQLFREESGLDTEMPRSENLPPEQYNVQKNSTSSQKGIGTSYNTRSINEIASMKSIHRETNVEQARPKSPKEIKIVSPTSRKKQANETTEINRKTMEKQKPYLSERNREGRNVAKEKAGSVSRNAEVMKRRDRKSAVSRSSRTCDAVKPNLLKPPNNSRVKRVSMRKFKSSTIDEIVAYEIEREIFNALDQIDGPSTEHSATPSDEGCPSADWDEESSVGDILKDSGEPNETLLSAIHDYRISSADGDAIHPSIDRTPTKEAEIKDEISLLLLNDKSFLSRAAELIGIDVYGDLNEQCSRISKVELKNHKLYLDAAGEQLELKHCQQNSLCYTGLQGQKRRSSAYFSLEELLRDISNGIRNLKGYCSEDGRGTKDSLDMKLERDLSCTDALINTVWDMGWRGLICMEETDCFVRDAGEDILSLLIEEAALDMCLHDCTDI